jgi:hypothetical protein
MLSDLDLLTVTFQNGDLSLYNVRDYLDVAFRCFPNFLSIVVLKAGIKAQQSNENLTLTNYEANCIQHLSKPDEPQDKNSESDLQC